MKILTVIISLGLMVFLGQQAVTLNKLTVCRQEAWRASIVLHTRALLSSSSTLEKDFILNCRIVVSRNEKKVSWIRITSPSRHHIPLRLQGKL